MARRTREIGVHVTLGAGPGVGHLILRGALRLVVVGCGLELLGVYAVNRTTTVFLYDVNLPDLTVLLSAVLLFLAIALIASFVPLRRALRKSIRPRRCGGEQHDRGPQAAISCRWDASRQQITATTEPGAGPAATAG